MLLTGGPSVPGCLVFNTEARSTVGAVGWWARAAAADQTRCKSILANYYLMCLP